MHECQLRPLTFYCTSEFAELGDRLAAKRSAKMSQKNQQNGVLAAEFAQTLSGLCPVGV